MREIGSGPNYRVAVDVPKNRAYLYSFGDALNDSGVSSLLDDMKKALNSLKPGFTLLADFTGLKLFGLPDLVRTLHNMVLEAGVRKVASVWSEESFAKFMIDSLAQKAKGGTYAEIRRSFKSLTEAEAWLDE